MSYLPWQIWIIILKHRKQNKNLLPWSKGFGSKWSEGRWLQWWTPWRKKNKDAHVGLNWKNFKILITVSEFHIKSCLPPHPHISFFILIIRRCWTNLSANQLVKSLTNCGCGEKMASCKKSLVCRFDTYILNFDIIRNICHCWHAYA